VTRDPMDDDPPGCPACVDRPFMWLWRFRHRLWVCTSGHAWYTYHGRWTDAVWVWRRWPRRGES
jgi:hypothetical protein